MDSPYNWKDLLVKPNKQINFFLPIIPKAQRRSRSKAIKTKSGQWTAMNYKDEDQNIREENLRQLLYGYKPDIPWAGAIILNVIIGLPIPKSWSQKKRTAAAYQMISHTSKPDIDNLLKHLKDCMKGVFYQDDRQIFAVVARKQYADIPGWDICISEV